MARNLIFDRGVARSLIFDRDVPKSLIFDRGVAGGLIFDRGVARIVVVGHNFFHYSLYFFISNSVYFDFCLKLLTLFEHLCSLLHFDEVSEHTCVHSCILMRFRSTPEFTPTF